MPKETIHDRTSPIATNVSWGSEGGYIQLATVAAGHNGEPTEKLFEIINNWLEEAEMPEIDLAKLREASSGARVGFDGWYAHIDQRWQVNDLIRLLRKARDRAFGADA